MKDTKDDALAKLHRVSRQMCLYGLTDQQVEVVLQLMAEFIETLIEESVVETKRVMKLMDTLRGCGGQA